MEEESVVSVSENGEEMDRVLPGDCRGNGSGENQWMPFHGGLPEGRRATLTVWSYSICILLVIYL